jgi:hypothetical protein
MQNCQSTYIMSESDKEKLAHIIIPVFNDDDDEDDNCMQHHTNSKTNTNCHFWHSDVYISVHTQFHNLLTVTQSDAEYCVTSILKFGVISKQRVRITN